MTQKPFFLSAFLTLCTVGALSAQQFLMNGTPINACNGVFYDSGGPNGDYANNQNLSTTICANGGGGTHVQLTFTGLSLGAGDLLCFYDGPNAGAPQLACSDDYPPGQPFIVQATAANPSGCLTITFNSDAVGVGAGWSAVLNCVASCQTVLADLTTTTPPVSPADTGWIDICPGDRVFFTGAGIYPQNNLAYAQSDLTTTFEWNFGDGDISYGPNTSHRFTEPGGYYVQLFLTDAQGCKSTNLINQRVRVAQRPIFDLSGALDNTICAGDTIQLSAAVDSASDKTVLVLPSPLSFTVEGSRADSLALPDGTGIPYETSIFFSEFSPGQVLANPNDLESVCVNIEHSWMRDVEITLTCPSGQSIILHNFAGQVGGGVYLGIPNDNDGFNPIPGTGFDYCWTPNASNPTWITYANTILGGSGTLPPGDYASYDPFSDLIGCPLNGEWTITVTDLWPIDNGFIFSWSLKFADFLYPNIETFTPQFVNWYWNNHPSIFYMSPDSIAAAPQNAGTAGYTFTVEDDFGCVWDTLVGISVLPYLHPDCYVCQDQYPVLADTAVCAGSPVDWDVSSLAPNPVEVRFESYPDYAIGNANHPHVNPYASPILVNSLGYNQLTDPLAQITSVCVDLETDFDADIHLILRSPNNQLLELSTGNGGSGDNYKITCFTPTASTPISAGTAPFAGNFRPEGAWSSLNNATVNGNWELLVSDGFGPTKFGRLKWWSIGFNFTDNIQYTWSNGAGLSCNNCPDPTAMPTSDQQYFLTAVNSLNCVYRDTVAITVNAFFPAPANLQVISLGTGTMVWAWDPVPGASGYEVMVNGGAWVPANGGASHTVSGLMAGDLVQISVRALNNSPNCPPNVADNSATYVLCALDASLNNILPALCNGTATGSAFISVSNANPPVEFLPEGNLPAFINGDFVNFFPAGNHFVVVRDAAGCRDTVFFAITEPPPIDINVSNTPVGCFNANTGSLTATATGGVGTLDFAWQRSTGGPVFNTASVPGLFAGAYNLTVTDDNNCTATASTTIDQPMPFQFNAAQDSVSCNGGSDGSATLNVSGGTPNYTILWDNGDNGPAADMLDAGFHAVTVTDANNCQAVTLVQVLEPAVLLIDSFTLKAVNCFGGTNGSLSVFARGGVSPFLYQWNDPLMQTTMKAQNLSAGTYQVTITDARGCTISGQATLGQSPALVLGFPQVLDERCQSACDGEISVSAGGGSGQYTFQWSDPGIPTGTTVATNLCVGLYSVTVQDNLGCTATGNTSINSPAAIVLQSTGIDPLCQGLLNGIAGCTASGGASGFQFLWNNGASTSNIQNLDCGTYTVTVTDANGCTASTEVVLDCPQVIQIDAITPEAARCFGEASGRITVSASGGSGILAYQWSDPLGQTGPVAVNLADGLYLVTITDGNGCSATASTTVIEPPPIGLSFEKTDVRCFGESSGAITATAAGGNGNFTYQWNNMLSGAQIENLLPGVYTVTATDALGCTASAVAPTITQPATAVGVSIIQVHLTCFGDSTGVAQAIASGGSGQPYTFLWSNGQNTAPASQLFVGTFTVTVSDQRGCTGTQSIDIGSYEAIDVLGAFTLPSCYNTNDAVAAVTDVAGGAGNGALGSYFYTWSVPAAPNSSALQGLAGGQNYTVVVSDTAGCTGSFLFEIPDKPAIVIELTTTDVSCAGFSDGASRVFSVQNAVNPYAIQWSNNVIGQVITNVPAGAYSLVLTDATGCTQTATALISEPEPLSLNFSVKPLKCPKETTARIIAAVTGGTPAYQLNWSNGVIGDTISDLGAGMYSISIVDQQGCLLTDSVRVEEPDSMLLQVSRIEPSCFGARNGRLTITVDGGTPPLRYSLNGDDFSGSSTYLAQAAGTYQFVVRDGNACTAQISGILEQPPALLVTATIDTTILLGQSILLEAEVVHAVGVPTFVWKSSLVDTIRCIDSLFCDVVLVSPEFPITYMVTVQDGNGCLGEASIRVNVEKPRGVYVPSGFTPNGDANNDLLQVFGKSTQIKSVELFRVYDRWGELVYEDKNFKVNDLTRGWDGNFKGEKSAAGLYVWYVSVEYLDGFKELLHGSSTLIR